MQKSVEPEARGRPATATEATFSIVVALSFAHLLNDMMQSLLPAMYPLIKESYGLDFGQIGLITLAFQLTASLLQPVVGMYTDRRPQPFSLVAGMGCTLVGLIVLAHAGSYRDAARGRGDDRHGFLDLPPRVDAHGPPRIGRAAWLRPVAVPGRRTGGPGDRAAAGCIRGGAARAGELVVVLAGGAVRNAGAAAGRPLVPAPGAAAREAAHAGEARARPPPVGGCGWWPSPCCSC